MTNVWNNFLDLLAQWKNILDFTFWGNTVYTYLSVFLLLLCAGLCAKIFSQYISKYLKKIANKMGRKSVNMLVDAASRSSALIFYGVAIILSIHILEVTEGVRKVIDISIQVAIGFTIIYFLFKTVNVVFAFLAEKAGKTKTKLDDAILPVLAKTVKIFMLIIIIVFILNNLGYNVASIIAGLGIGGVAITFASQDTIKNVFGSIVLFADRRFNIGDRVIVDGVDGPIENIGFWSTRIRTLDGTLVTIPNSRMADATINNINKRTTRKTSMKIGVTYDTGSNKMRKALDIIRTTFKDHPSTDNSLAYWNEFGDFSLNILAIHWCKYLDYGKYLQAMEEINFAIYDAFGKEGIEFAFPSQTIYVEKSN